MKGRFDPWLPTLLLSGLALRLIGLDEPLIDQQAWRQTDTAAIARNFLDEGYDLLRPRVDWRGISSGVVETNFPLYPYLVACLYGVAGGASEWLGRLLSALFSSLAAVPVYALGRRLAEAATATVAEACVAQNALCGTFEMSDVDARLEQGFRLFPSDRQGRFRQFWTGRENRQ